MAHVRRRYRGREYDARTMLLMLGMGDTIATLVIPHINFLPRTTDPDSASVMMMVKAIQINMASLGCPLTPDGWLGPETSRCIAAISGAGWYDKTWIQIIGDVLDAKDSGFRFKKPSRGLAMGADEEPKSSLVPILLVAGTVIGALWITQKAG